MFTFVLCLTQALRFLATPVGGAGVAAGQHAGPLQLVAGEAGEESLPPGVKAAHRHVTVERPPGEDAAQHKGCRGRQEGEDSAEREVCRG